MWEDHEITAVVIVDCSLVDWIKRLPSSGRKRAGMRAGTKAGMRAGMRVGMTVAHSRLAVSASKLCSSIKFWS